MSDKEEDVPCPLCVLEVAAQPHLREACASVGLAHGVSAEQMLRDFLLLRHAGGHEATLAQVREELRRRSSGSG